VPFAAFTGVWSRQVSIGDVRRGASRPRSCWGAFSPRWTTDTWEHLPSQPWCCRSGYVTPGPRAVTPDGGVDKFWGGLFSRLRRRVSHRGGRDRGARGNARRGAENLRSRKWSPALCRTCMRLDVDDRVETYGVGSVESSSEIESVFRRGSSG